MKAQGTVKGNGRFEPVEDVQEASRLAVKQLGISGPHLIGPGWGPHFFLWTAFKEALKALPVVPTWPTWRP